MSTSKKQFPVADINYFLEIIKNLDKEDLCNFKDIFLKKQYREKEILSVHMFAEKKIIAPNLALAVVQNKVVFIDNSYGSKTVQSVSIMDFEDFILFLKKLTD